TMSETNARASRLALTLGSLERKGLIGAREPGAAGRWTGAVTRGAGAGPGAGGASGAAGAACPTDGAGAPSGRGAAGGRWAPAALGTCPAGAFSTRGIGL